MCFWLEGVRGVRGGFMLTTEVALFALGLAADGGGEARPPTCALLLLLLF